MYIYIYIYIHVYTCRLCIKWSDGMYIHDLTEQSLLYVLFLYVNIPLCCTCYVCLWRCDCCNSYVILCAGGARQHSIKQNCSRKTQDREANFFTDKSTGQCLLAYYSAIV